LPDTIDGWKEIQWNAVGMTMGENAVKCLSPELCFPQKPPEDVGFLRNLGMVIGHLKSARHAEKYK